MTGILSMFLFLGVLQDTLAASIQGVITDKHFVSGQKSSYFNDGNYTALLNAEYYEVEAQKYETVTEYAGWIEVFT